MSGHSKWDNIKHRKAAQDSVRGTMFAKLAKEIFVAAKQGGPETETNAALRLAISKAKAKSMPSKNIQKAIEKATGTSKDVLDYKEYLFEGYLPAGISVMIDCLSDNVNRITANVKYIFARHGGNLGKNGSVAFLFARKGILSFQSATLDEEALMTIVLEAGADDFEKDAAQYFVATSPQQFMVVKNALEAAGISDFTTAEIRREPHQLVQLEATKMAKIKKAIAAFEADDDVQNVAHNLDLKTTT